QEQSGNQADGEWVHLVYVLSEGAVDGLEDIMLGEESISTYGAYATYELVVNPTTVNAFLKANCKDWKDSQIGTGLSFVRLSLCYNAEKFPSGIPDARFIVRGRNDIYDPRTGAAGYTSNTALHILWYLRTRCGIPDDEIVMSTFASAANVCDETVTNADGSVSPRYATSCVIGADEQRTQVLQKLEASCAGKLIRVGGRWMLQAGAYYGPYDFEITEDMVVGTVTGGTEPSNDAAINTVRGTFTDPSQSWADTDYPEVVIDEWVTEDGGEAAETLSYSYVLDPYQAQRLANIELRRRRAGGAISFSMNFLGYNCRPGRVVWLNLASLNIQGEFIVTDWTMGVTEGCTITLAQYDPAIYDDAVGQPYNPIGFISLPAGGLGSPTDLAWIQDDTAEVTQGVLSWTPPTGIVTGYAITVRQGGTAVQAQQVPATSTQVPLAGLPSGSYTMSVASIGPLARSGEASITVNIDGPPVPEACAVQSSLESIVLIPSNPLHGLNGGTYEYFYTMDATAEADAAEYIGQGLTMTHTGLAFYTNYYYFIRSRNAYGVSGFLKVPASTSNDVRAFLAALAGQISETELSPELNDKITDLADQIAALDGLSAYKEDQTYTTGDMVVAGGRIYQATQDVPEETPPPNADYWLDVGQSIETANGLAQQVEQNTTKITDLESEASSLHVLRAAYRDDDGEGDLQDALNMWATQAAYSKEVVVRANQNEALVQTTETLQVSVASNSNAAAQNTAAIQTVATAQANIDGTLSTMWSVKMQLNANGQYVAAGIGLGIENTGAGLQSQFLVSADRFAVVGTTAGGTVFTPFVIQNGQVYINQAFIADGTITSAKIGDYIQSSNYVAGQAGWRLGVSDNTFELNATVSGEGRMVITNRAIKVYDGSDVKRVQLGDLNA
ncbi:phage tail tip fiber protein, partial [Pseudomonas typographi]|uniref:phage tail tip fiber protein n=1 Tax=Pseudomonas typographi TaxID=2715964 RepID=UPI001685918C